MKKQDIRYIANLSICVKNDGKNDGLMENFTIEKISLFAFKYPYRR